MKMKKKFKIAALSLFIGCSFTSSHVEARLFREPIRTDAPVELISNAVTGGESPATALVRHLGLLPDFTPDFIHFAVKEFPDQAIDLIVAAVTAYPDRAIEIAMGAVSALPESRVPLLGAALDNIDDPAARIAAICSGYNLLDHCFRELRSEYSESDEPDIEEVAEIEEASEPDEDDVEDIAEIEEAPPPLPSFLPAPSDKPSSISPT